MLSIEVVDDLTRFEELTVEWRGLQASGRRITPFQTPEWLVTWWRHFGGGALRVFVIRDGGELTGVIPCFLHEWRGRRQLTLIGSGVSDYLEPAIAPSRVREAVDLLSAELMRAGDFDICDWQDLDADTPLARLDGAITQCDTPCSAIPLCETFDSFLAARSKDLRRNLRRYAERAEREAQIEFAITGEPEPELLSALVRLHAARWERKQEPGMIAANNLESFLRDIARLFSERGHLRLFAVRYKSEIVAVSIGFLLGGVLYSYLSAFDPRYEILGFGRKLLYESLRHAFARGWTEWNFCRGDEAYKFSWGAQAMEKRRVTR